MAECKHELPLLMGTADGIVCRGCGRLFASFDEIFPKVENAPREDVAPQDKPKRVPRKKKQEENE